MKTAVCRNFNTHNSHWLEQTTTVWNNLNEGTVNIEAKEHFKEHFFNTFPAQKCHILPLNLIHHHYNVGSVQIKAIDIIGILLARARKSGLKQNVCHVQCFMSGLLSAIVIFMTWQTPVLKCPKSGCFSSNFGYTSEFKAEEH